MQTIDQQLQPCNIARAEFVRLQTLGLTEASGGPVADNFLQMGADCYADWKRGVTCVLDVDEDEARRSGVWFEVRRDQRQQVIKAYATLRVDPPADFTS
jgi:hypothetical protein